MRRLTSVLPSRLARILFNSLTIFSNSTNRSCCRRTASSILLPAGDFAVGFADCRRPGRSRSSWGVAGWESTASCRGPSTRRSCPAVATRIRCRRPAARAAFPPSCRAGRRRKVCRPRPGACPAFGPVAAGLPPAVRALAASLQQIGHRRHAVGRNILENLQHLGPAIQRTDVELRITGRLPEQIFARRRQSREPAAVGALGGGLVLDAPADIGPIQLLRRKVAKLLVGFVQLQLAVANLQRLAVPFVELFGHPDRVLLGIEDVQDVVGRVDPLAAREVVLGEYAEVDRLRFDTQRLRRERAAGFNDCVSRIRLPQGCVRPWRES